MRDNTRNVVHQSMFNGVQVYSPSDPSAGLSPAELTVLMQCLQPQNPYSSGNRFSGTHHRPFPGSSDTRTSVLAAPGNNGIQNITTQWPASAMEFSFREPFVPNDVTVSEWRETYENGLAMEHYPPLIAPTMSQIEPPGIEDSRRAHYLGHSLQHSSVPSYPPRVSLYHSPISPATLDTSLESVSEALSQAISQSPSEECYNLWKKIPVDAIVVTGSDEFVPQTMYEPLTEANKERYIEQATLSPPIIFMTKQPFEWGIPLEDIRDRQMQRLVDKDVPVLQNCGPSVSIRINWPGYPSFKRQISSRNWRKMKGPITKEKLAQRIAKTTGQFIEKMSHKPLGAGAEDIWRVGVQHIKVEDLILVSLHHVSKGSWQPQFRLRRDLR